MMFSSGDRWQVAGETCHLSLISCILLAVLLLLSACDQADQPESSPTAPEIAPAATSTEPVAPTATTVPPASASTPIENPTLTPSPSPNPPLDTPSSSSPAGSTDAVSLELVAEGLTAPIALVPDGSGRLFVADQIGLIRVIDAEGQLLDEPFLDLRDRIVLLNASFDERGLLGLALHPNYAENGRFFVYYSAPLRLEAPENYNHTSHLAEFRVSSDDPNRADPASERILLQVDQPQPNHNGGQITFGPDGYLYIPLGDGGAAADVGLGHVPDWYEDNEGGNGQDINQNLLGSILRIGVDAEGVDGRPYGIPADNPFVDGEGLPEIYAYGFRNPFRIAFDSGGQRQLFAGDAGQNLWEEVDIVTAGGNYGWNVREGTHCFSAANPNNPPEQCPETVPDGQPLLSPIIEYQNANAPGGLGLAVIGGNVYRGSRLPQFEGWYFFGDWSTRFDVGNGRLFVSNPPEEDGQLWPFHELMIANAPEGRLGAYLLSFGQDGNGELYLLTSEESGPVGNTGQIYRILSAEETAEAAPS